MLYAAVDAGYGFPGAEDAGDLTTMQMAFLRHADVQRQKAFLDAIAEMFSE